MGQRTSQSLSEDSSTAPLLDKNEGSSHRPLFKAWSFTNYKEEKNDLDLESLDFAPIHSRAFATEMKFRYGPRRIYGYTGLTLAKWTCTIVIGILIGFASYFIEYVSEQIRLFKMASAMTMIITGHTFYAYLGYLSYGIIITVIVSAIVLYWAPAAAGGGVTLVMANLNGVHVPDILSRRTLITKIFGTTCAVTTGLAVGPEGPLVHIGAAIAYNLTAFSAMHYKLKHPLSHSPPSSTSPSFSLSRFASKKSAAKFKSQNQMVDEYDESIHDSDMAELSNLSEFADSSKSPFNGDELAKISTDGKIMAKKTIDMDPASSPFPIPSASALSAPVSSSSPSPVTWPSGRDFLTRNMSEKEFEMERNALNHGLKYPNDDEENKWSFMNFFSKFFPNHIPVDFHNDLDQREFISAGAAAGLASAFGAPIGGVLFSLEEASSFWSKKVMWRSLLCASLATVVLSLLRGSGNLSHTGLLSFHELQPTFNLSDIPFIIFTSASVGLLGTFFNQIHGWISYRRINSSYRFLRIVEVCGIVFLSVSMMFILSLLFGNCLEQSDLWAEDEDFGYVFNCPTPESESKKYYNDLATLFFSIPDHSIRSLLESNSQDTYSLKSVSIFIVAYLIMFELVYGAAMPGGLFMPSMLVGSSFGFLLGTLMTDLFPSWDIEPGHHALVGATAMLGGVFRGSISLVVIMVEGTGGIDFIVPIIIAIIVSNWVSHFFTHKGAYESDLERLGNVAFLQNEPPHNLAQLSVEDIMCHNVVGFDKVVKVSEVLKMLKSSKHNGFPVFSLHENGTPQGARHLIGLILRSQLLLLLEQRMFVSYRKCSSPYHLAKQLDQHFMRIPITRQQILIDRAMRVYHLFHFPHNRHLSALSSAVDRLGLNWLVKEERENLPRISEDGVGVDIQSEDEDGNDNHHRGGEGERVEGRTVQRAEESRDGECRESREIDGNVDMDGQLAREAESAESGEIAEESTAFNAGMKFNGIDYDDLALDLRPYMNHAPISVRKECSAHRAYVTFRSLGLRHLPVVDSDGRVVGMLTRKDLSDSAKRFSTGSKHTGDPFSSHGHSQGHGYMSEEDKGRGYGNYEDILYRLP